jgi:hypothetical protein
MLPSRGTATLLEATPIGQTRQHSGLLGGEGQQHPPVVELLLGLEAALAKIVDGGDKQVLWHIQWG